MVNIILNDFVVLLILTALNILAVVYTWKVGKVFNSKSWNFIAWAVTFLLLNRAISFLSIFGLISYSGTVALLDTVYIPLIFWTLVSVGMLRIYYKIVSSMEIEKKFKRVGKKRSRLPYYSN